MQEAVAAPAGYGMALLQTLFALGIVCALAFLAFRLLDTLRFRGAPGRRIRVIERTSLDARHALYLVSMDERELLIATSEGAPTLIREVGADDSESSAIVEPSSEAAAHGR